MPELPEVETVVRGLRPRLTGRRIEHVTFLSPLAAGRQPALLESQLKGRTVQSVGRVGKFIVCQLDHGVMTVHLRMTGKLMLDVDPGRHTRAVFELDRGRMVFDDLRQFGRITWSEELPANAAALGPDALTIGAEEFVERLRSRRGRLKPLLLDQSLLAGVGNIYADEALHRAGLHPLADSARLTRQRAARLHGEIVAVLNEAVAAGGSSVSDYVDADGRPGLFQVAHRVYGREGEPCLACGSLIRRLVIAQRSAHFCPRCQRAPRAVSEKR